MAIRPKMRAWTPEGLHHVMGLALEQAAASAKHGDVPVGAVVLDRDHRLIGVGRNRRVLSNRATAHAEIEALDAAAKHLGSWRLDGSTLVVTLEPCLMCAGAALQSRIAQVVYGCPEPKSGAVSSLFVVGRDPRLAHQFDVVAGVRGDEGAQLLKSFFASRRPRT